MACRDTYIPAGEGQGERTAGGNGAGPDDRQPVETLLFGVDSGAPVDRLFQNSLTQFEWVVRNKPYPHFWGKFFGGRYAVTAEEIDSLHALGCKVALLYNGYGADAVGTERQGRIDAKKAFIAAAALGVPPGCALFLDAYDAEGMTAEYMKGFAGSLARDGYQPGVYAKTDASSGFHHQFSRGYRLYPEIYSRYLIWAASPSLAEYYRTDNARLLHPDYWGPTCPSCVSQSQIAIWQYGRECHPVNEYTGRPTAFNVNLVKDPSVILEKMF